MDDAFAMGGRQPLGHLERIIRRLASGQCAGGKLLDNPTVAYLEGLDKATPIAFHCHHGGRSQNAAEHFLSKGFKNVYNLAGGIDAWSRDVDPKVPRY